MARKNQLIPKNYVPSLNELQACCSRNYVNLERLLRSMGSDNILLYSSKNGQSLRITREQQAPYTTTIRLCQQHGVGPSYLKPSMLIRMYHDGGMAEVLSCQQISGVRARYDYPNSRMHQRDEKMQINQFLAEWLTFCLEHGMKPNWAYKQSFI